MNESASAINYILYVSIRGSFALSTTGKAIVVTAFNKTVGRDELARIKVVDKKGCGPLATPSPDTAACSIKLKCSYC